MALQLRGEGDEPDELGAIAIRIVTARVRRELFGLRPRVLGSDADRPSLERGIVEVEVVDQLFDADRIGTVGFSGSRDRPRVARELEAVAIDGVSAATVTVSLTPPISRRMSTGTGSAPSNT